MKKIWILGIVLLMIGNFSWGVDLTLKAGKITNLPYKTDFVGGFSFDFSVASSVNFLKNLRGDLGFLIANPDWQLWENTLWLRANQILFDLGLSYQLSFKVKKIRLQPYFGIGAGYLLASLDWQENSYYWAYDYYRPGRYSLERKNSFNPYLGVGLKVFLSKNIFVKPEIKIYQNERTMTAFLIGVGYQVKSRRKRS